LRRRGIPLYRTSRRIVFLSNALRPKADYYAHYSLPPYPSCKCEVRKFVFFTIKIKGLRAD
ncbi:hypothetical protein, partial [Nitrosomonas sp. Nm58]|uniref:hypothetical protein n=1 Tax=Nitrosomonas sp. Nm58 TaxID=200126 RepID=UPI001C432A3A